MPKKNNFLSKEPKSRLRVHIETLLLFLLLSCTILLFVTVMNYKQFIYPDLHRFQESPEKYVEKASRNLPVKPEVFEHGSRDKKRVALTFDADMTQAMYLLLKKGIVKSWYNRPIKDTLDKEGVRATVFLSGLWAKAYPKESNDLAQDPLIEIGSHSYSHPAFTKNCYSLPFMDNSKDQDEVEEAQNAIFLATGITPRYFRFPGGCFDKVDVETVAKLGLKIVHWDVVAEDGFNNNVDSIVERVLSRTQNGSIIVFHIHDGAYAPKTNDALIKIIPQLKNRGFEFVKVSEILGI